MQVFCWFNWLGEGKDLRTITFGFIPNTKQVNVYLFTISHILLFDIVVGHTWKFCFFKLRYSWNVCNVKKNRITVNVVKSYNNRMVPPVPCCSLLHILQLQELKSPAMTHILIAFIGASYSRWLENFHNVNLFCRGRMCWWLWEIGQDGHGYGICLPS